MNPTVSVLVPWRASPEREPLWAYVRAWWAKNHPDWQVVAGACPDGPWVKALAVGDALTRADGDILCVADADVLTPGVGDAVAAVVAGAPWAIPHRRVYRLTPEATTAVLAGGPLPDPVGGRRARIQPGRRPSTLIVNAGPVRESHDGLIGGGMVVLTRDLYDRVPLDPRFLGWGQEDSSWGLALLAVAPGPPHPRTHHPQPPYWGREPLWHLHHPPQPRLGKSRAVGSMEGLALYHRYRDAVTPDAMASLLAEFA